MRYICTLMLLALSLGAWQTLQAWQGKGTTPGVDGVPNLLFELSIDGENFVLESDKQTELKAANGKTYKVALRLARRQRWALNNVKFEYDAGFRVDDDNDDGLRTATLTHEMGFQLAMMEGGKAPAIAERPKVLARVVDSIVKSYTAGGATGVQAAPPETKKYGAATAVEQKITYTDRNRKASVTRVALLVAGDQTATAILSYPAADEAEVTAMAKVTFESFQAK
jgi:hypothetical protein